MTAACVSCPPPKARNTCRSSAGRNIAYEGIRLDEAILILSLAGGRIPPRTTVQLVALRHLRARGVVTYADNDEQSRTPADLALTDETRFNLCLD